MMDTAKDEMVAAHQDMVAAKKSWQEAKEAQLEAFQYLNNHDISLDEFEEYLKDTATRRDIFLDKQVIFRQKKAIYDRIKHINSED